jgi:hypothetical protein
MTPKEIKESLIKQLKDSLETDSDIILLDEEKQFLIQSLSQPSEEKSKLSHENIAESLRVILAALQQRDELFYWKQFPSEDLPNEDCFIQVWRDGFDVSQTMYFSWVNDATENGGGWYLSELNGDEVKDTPLIKGEDVFPTHWMPLPEPPTENEALREKLSQLEANQAIIKVLGGTDDEEFNYIIEKLAELREVITRANPSEQLEMIGEPASVAIYAKAEIDSLQKELDLHNQTILLLTQSNVKLEKELEAVREKIINSRKAIEMQDYQKAWDSLYLL